MGCLGVAWGREGRELRAGWRGGSPSHTGSYPSFSNSSCPSFSQTYTCKIAKVDQRRPISDQTDNWEVSIKVTPHAHTSIACSVHFGSVAAWRQMVDLALNEIRTECQFHSLKSASFIQRGVYIRLTTYPVQCTDPSNCSLKAATTVRWSWSMCDEMCNVQWKKIKTGSSPAISPLNYVA